MKFARFESYKLFRGQQLGDVSFLRSSFKQAGVFKVCARLAFAFEQLLLQCFCCVSQGTVRVLQDPNEPPLFDIQTLFRSNPVVVRDLLFIIHGFRPPIPVLCD